MPHVGSLAKRGLRAAAAFGRPGTAPGITAPGYDLTQVGKVARDRGQRALGGRGLRTRLQERAGVGVTRRAQHDVGRPAFGNLAGIHHMETVSVFRHYAQIMGDQQHGRPHFAGTVLQQHQDLPLHLGDTTGLTLLPQDLTTALGDAAVQRIENLSDAQDHFGLFLE